MGAECSTSSNSGGVAKVSKAYHTKWEQSTPHRHHSLLDTICDCHQELKYDLKQWNQQGSDGRKSKLYFFMLLMPRICVFISPLFWNAKNSSWENCKLDTEWAIWLEWGLVFFQTLKSVSSINCGNCGLTSETTKMQHVSSLYPRKLRHPSNWGDISQFVCLIEKISYNPHAMHWVYYFTALHWAIH